MLTRMGLPTERNCSVSVKKLKGKLNRKPENVSCLEDQKVCMDDKYLKSEPRTQIQGCAFITLRQANKKHSYVLVLQNYLLVPLMRCPHVVRFLHVIKPHIIPLK